MNRIMRAYDWPLVVVCLFLLSSGLTILYSLSLAGDKNYFQFQLLYFFAGLVMFVLVSCVSVSQWRVLSEKLLWITCFLLFLTLIIGNEVKGAQRWLVWGGFSIQPAEFFKFVLLLSLARRMASAGENGELGVRTFFQILICLFPGLFLIFLQPDFGTLCILVLTTLIVAFLAGLQIVWVFIGSLLAVGGAMIMIITEPYRVQRFVEFWNPLANPYGGGYSQLHSLIGYETGGWFGVGLGRSVEKYQHLPEAHNDFIIAIIAEETGLVGFFIICALYLFVVARAIGIGRYCDLRGERFGTLYAFSLSALVFMQVIINIGGSLSLLPSKGFTLPLVSYGGSSLWATLMMFAVLLRIAWEGHYAVQTEMRSRYA